MKSESTRQCTSPFPAKNLDNRMPESKHSHDDKESDQDSGVRRDEPSTNSDESGATRSLAKVEKQEAATQPTGPPPPPNGGYGWTCTVCCAVINAHTWGLNSSYGVFLAHYLATEETFPGGTYLQFAFVGSLSISCAMLISPVATLCVGHFGVKPTLFIGIFLETASLIGASFASEMWQLFLSQGICFGFVSARSWLCSVSANKESLRRAWAFYSLPA